MTTKVWALDKSKQWIEIDDPVVTDDSAADYDAAIADAGYVIEMENCADPADPEGYKLKVHQKTGPTDYRFYVDLMGMNSQMAVVVARNFPELLDILARMQPLLQMLQRENVDSVHRMELQARWEAERKRNQKKPRGRT